MNMHTTKGKVILVSACVAGANCRYDGKNKAHKTVVDLLSEGELLIVCPEVLAGLSTPRTPCQIVGGDGHDVLEGKAKVMGEDGKDYTKAFIKGARRACKIALEKGVTHAYLREKSPSCGYGIIYSDTDLIKGDGVFAALLKKNGIKVINLKE